MANHSRLQQHASCSRLFTPIILALLNFFAALTAGELLFEEGSIALFDPPTDTAPTIPTPGDVAWLPLKARLAVSSLALLAWHSWPYRVD
jgi:hypothetical protein